MPRKSNSNSKAYNHINKLRDYFVNDDISVRMLNDKEHELRKTVDAMAIIELPAIASMLKDAQDIVEEINTILKESKNLTSEERRALMGERDAHEFYIDRFSGEDAEKKRKAIEQYLEEKIIKYKLI